MHGPRKLGADGLGEDLLNAKAHLLAKGHRNSGIHVVHFGGAQGYGFVGLFGINLRLLPMKPSLELHQLPQQETSQPIFWGQQQASNAVRPPLSSCLIFWHLCTILKHASISQIVSVSICFNGVSNDCILRQVPFPGFQSSSLIGWPFSKASICLFMACAFFLVSFIWFFIFSMDWACPLDSAF